ncbi:MAG: hypothetical protein IJL53_08925 [Firmicutes bacterium]|nr:hypothetical protein [Bacillota bacterium]
MAFEEVIERQRREAEAIGPEKRAINLLCNDAPCYTLETILPVANIGWELRRIPAEERPAKIEEVHRLLAAVKRKSDAPERIYLWPEGKIPTLTEYTDEKDYRFNHGPSFAPYMFALLIPEDQTPKGAVVVCPGGDHGSCVLSEGYQTCLDLNALGYQCFLLLNRPNHNPWSAQEAGADASRAIRMVRANAAKYRISPDKVAYAGFSNGGLTGDACIQYYSGEQTVKETFPDYELDEYDSYYGAPDAFLCVYGPRFDGAPYDYSRVKYPPTFFAVGREDPAMKNLNYMVPSLLAHDVPVEVHTFAGVPHGQAGIRITGAKPFANFDLWVTLADAFLTDLWK